MALGNINTNLFKKEIIDNFINNLMEVTCSTLANMLAIDYEIRLNSKPEARKYIAKCILRLKNYLGFKVINNDDFSVALKLFAIIISPEDENNQNKDNIEQSQDIIAENLIEMYFGTEKLNSSEKQKIKGVFRVLLKEKNFDNIINYAQSQKKLFRTSVMYTINKYNTPEEVSSYIKQEFNKILEISSEFTTKSNIFKQTTGKIAGAICVLAAGAISVATAGATFSVLVLPASIFAVKYAPKLGEKIGELILNNDKAIKLEQDNINNFMEKLYSNNENLLTQEKRKNLNKSTLVAPPKVNVTLDKKLGYEKHR